jgi:uncharacterized peroxidase-related enzyme
MSFIEVIEVAAAEGKLADIYKRVQSPDGQVDNVLKVHSLRPHTLQGHMTLYKSVLHHSGNSLPKWFLESIGVLVSKLNGCNYCAQHHAAGMQRLIGEDSALGGAFFENCMNELESTRPGDPFSPTQQAALVYARKLTVNPGGICDKDVEGMRTAGLQDGEILEINQVASYFSYANRTVSGLGVNTENEVVGLSPGDSDDPNNWGHK